MLKNSVITGSMGILGDRFVLEGYKENTKFAEKVARLAAIPGLTGLELTSDPDGDEANAARSRAILNDHGLVCACVNAPVAGKRVFGKGALSNVDPAIRRLAIDACKRSSDFAAEMGAEVVNIWPGQDGFDYALCCDYAKAYEDFLGAAVEIADHNRQIRIGLEFKPREPRNRSLLDTCSTALLMSEQSGRANLGVTVDVGHVLYANANMAWAVVMCARSGRLVHMHMNDCLGYWDDDMILGSVHFIEYIELCYALRKAKYEGWCSVDIFPNREDAFACARESVAYLSLFDSMVDKVGMDALDACVARGDAAFTARTIREKVFG